MSVTMTTESTAAQFRVGSFVGERVLLYGEV